MNLRRWLREDRGRRGGRGRGKARPMLEMLESRVVLYTANGGLWPNPQLITISFMPDGTNLGGGIGSNLFASFNANPKLAGQWQNEILKAAQVWRSRPTSTSSSFPTTVRQRLGKLEEGDPGFGDIRIGGYAFGSSTLARTYQPPPGNDFSIAGDMAFNTAQNFSAGSGYNLSVAEHEFGHALDLFYSSASPAVMWPSYNGVKPNLSSDDIAGIRNIYRSTCRAPRHLRVQGLGNSIATAVNSRSVRSILTGLVNNLKIATTTSDLDFYTFNAPLSTTGNSRSPCNRAG